MLRCLFSLMKRFDFSCETQVLTIISILMMMKINFHRQVSMGSRDFIFHHQLLKGCHYFFVSLTS
jgi:hypothetical protein